MSGGWSAASPVAVEHRLAIDQIPVYSAALASSVPVTIRASSNEAPDGVSDGVRDAVVARLATANRYPALGGIDLIAAIADRLGAGTDEIAVADGSLSLLNYLLLAYTRPAGRVVAPWRSYEAYPICIRTAGAEPVLVPNRADGGHDLVALAAEGQRADVVILCSPNNPTGVALDHAEVAGLLAAVPDRVLVVLDEAYLDFDDDPEAPRGRELLAAHPNLVLLRTFSKAYGLAGLRIGYAVAHPSIISAVRRILPPFPVGALASAAATAALDDTAHHDRIVGSVLRQRAAVEEMLDGHGVPRTVSRSNFVWLPLGEHSERLGRLCADRGVSTRVFAGEGLRISLGEAGLVEALAAALDEFVSAGS